MAAASMLLPARVRSRASPADALEAVAEDTGGWVPGGMIRVAGTGRIGGLDRWLRRNPDKADGVETQAAAS